MKKRASLILFILACQASWGVTLNAQTGLWKSEPAALLSDFEKGHYLRAEQTYISHTRIYVCTGGGYMISLRDTDYTELSVTIPKGTIMTCQTTSMRVDNGINMFIGMRTAPNGRNEGWHYQSTWKYTIPETTCKAEVPPAINLGDLRSVGTMTIVIPVDLPSGAIRFESSDITGGVLMLGGNPSVSLTPGEGMVAGDLAWSITDSNPSIAVTTTDAMPGSYSSYATLTLSCQ
ncbi:MULTISPECIES: hypothetical protein [unclassified Pantoea]|uniref:hypothetical protein n=1 Tax=unclassified Pantoea TaxID=2630326 RepID=UPI0023DAB626|nr:MULTISPECIES: hypothetical protein [unclassified Pantoea]MDF2042164.1 hypothetical protein [Pantoea sp. Cr_R14]MDF2070622.1 hypothetical protein [Pantoea sp. Cr_R13]MDF2078272.1 hypothetical protein [Pantoea sp. Cr_R21]